MKKISLILIAAFLAIAILPAARLSAAEVEVIPAATSARTTLLDLTSTNSSSSNTAQGWSYNPTGYNGNPQLTLNSYGLPDQHSAPIKVRANTRIVVNGDCYIDNVYMGQKYNDITALCNGYLYIEGTGTLNLYANQYQGNCICKESGAESNHNDILLIDGVTVNCNNTPHNMNTAFSNEACIYAYKSMIIRNAVVNAYYGRWGIRIWGETPIGGVTEDTADEILIENSTVNIQNMVEDHGKEYERGIEATFGKVRVTNSHLTISAGHFSIYSYLSLTFDSGTVEVNSRPVGSGEAYPLVQCDRLIVNSGMTHVKLAATKYPLTCVLKCKSEGCSSLGSGLTVVCGTFQGGDFTPGADSASGLPVLEISDGSTDMLLGDVNCDGAVDFADVSALVAYVMNAGVVTPQGYINADANQDGVVDILDATAIYSIAMSR